MANVSFRIDHELKERIDELAARHGLNVSQIFRQALEEKIGELQHGPNRRGNFHLSLKERVVLANQFRILAAVDNESSDLYLKNVEALESGYELHYPWIVERFSEGMSPQDSREVLDILDMYSDLRFSNGKLDNKSSVEEKDIVFHGFDGNYESEYVAYALYFTIDLDRFNSLHPDIKKNGLNSHAPMLGFYRKMLEVWRKVRRPPAPLSAQGIRTILDARGW